MSNAFVFSEYRFYSKECLPQISASLRVNERHFLLHYTTHYGNAALIMFIVILTIVHVNGMTNWNRIRPLKLTFTTFLPVVIALLLNNVKGRKISWRRTVLFTNKPFWISTTPTSRTIRAAALIRVNRIVSFLLCSCIRVHRAGYNKVVF